MSSLRVDISPAKPTRQRDITSWARPDITRLSTRGKKRYIKRKHAVDDYFATDHSIEEITLRYHLSSDILMKLVGQCILQHEDGELWGYRALVPDVIVIDHTPVPHSTEEERSEEQVGSSTVADTEEVVDTQSNASDPSSIDEENETCIVDDEDTAKRQAIKIAPVIIPGASIAANSLNGNGHNGHQPGVYDEKSMATDVQAKTIEGEFAEATASDPELTAVAVEQDQAIAVQNESELEEVAEQQDIQTNGHSEEIEDFSELTTPEMVVEVVEEDAIDGLDGYEDELDTGTNADDAAEVADATGLPESSRMQLVVRENLIPAVLPLYGKGRKRTHIKKVARTRRSIRKRLIREVQARRGRRRFRSLVATILIASLMFVVFLPLVTGMAAYGTYTSIRGVALDGVNHLLTVKSLLSISKSDPTAALDAPKLRQAQSEFSMAESDFLQLQQLTNRTDVQSAIQQYAPQYSGELGMAQRLVQVGIDVSRLGNEVAGVGMLGAGLLHSSPLASGNTKPLISATDISDAEGVMIHAQYYINDIQAQMSQVSIQNLPISNTQKRELVSVLALMPKVQNYITQGQSLIGIISWLLGVDHTRHFLVQTMDRGELRPGGGFTGMYGLLTLQNGRMAPFSLTDVTELDYASNGMELNRQAPPLYRSWMKFGNWGLRDANLSGDFPTNAKLAMQVFQEEGGGPVDGNIALTPTVIAHVLNVIGPIKVPQYNEIITAQNLEDKLHYYQQDFGAIALERQKTGTHNAATRKAFTSLLGHLLLDKVRHEPVKVLVKIMQNAVKDIKSRDLEIYFTNPQAEGWMIQHGFSGATDTFAKQDGFMVVQSNISISKASQYVHTTEQDNISLDAQGGATHNLTITLDYKQTGPVYGYDTYADYIRVYAPPNAQLQGGDGFDSGKPLCIVRPPAITTTGGTKGTQGKSIAPVEDQCAAYASSFSSNARYCPNGNYALGPRGTGGNWPVDSLSGPTELTTDLAGRAMWGGLTLTPKNCISTITLQWYVPNAVRQTAGHPAYAILVQKQGGYIPTLDMTIDTSAIKGLKPINFQGDIVADTLFSLSALKKS